MGVDLGVRLLVGVVLLILGRKLFWVFVGAAGFIAGLNFAERVMTGADPVVVLLIAILAAIIGAVLAIFLQKIMIAVAGFFIGGYLILELLRLASIAVPQTWVLAVYVIGGIIGALLVLALFDWALIILSSIAGSALVTQSVHIAGATGGLLFLVLVIAGIAVQAALLRGSRTAV